MKRYDVIKQISEVLKDELIICNIGIPSKELFNIQDRPYNFYMLGSMGLASSIALGLAFAQPNKKIWCIDGDGSILMNLGSLSTIANTNPKNLTLIIIDNGSYGSTGNQKTHTSNKTKLELVAKGVGFKNIFLIDKIANIIPTLKKLPNECNFILIKAKPGNASVKNISLHPIEIKKRFMTSILK